MIKLCPFCGNEFSINYKEKYAFCQECLSNGIDIKVFGKDESEIIKKWNTRKFDEDFLNNFNYIDEYRDYLRGFTDEASSKLNIGEIRKIGKINDSCGCIIYPDGTIENVRIDHENTAKELLGVDRNSDLPYSADTIYEKMNILPVTFIYKYITANITKNNTNKQLDSLELFCIKNSSWCERFEFVFREKSEYTSRVEDIGAILKKIRSLSDRL